jgi:hypothetical protein
MSSFAKISAGLPLALLLGLPAAAAPDAGFAPLAFLVGHCWKGTFSDGKTTDEHCFSWIYHGKFMRDRHVVHSPGAADGFGESIYVWDAAAQQLQYLYIESGGGFSRGTVAAEGTTLVFPASTYSEGGKTQTIRSRWARAGGDAYDVSTEFQGKDGWVPGFALRMQRVAP